MFNILNNRKFLSALFLILLSIILFTNTNNIYKYILNSEMVINPTHKYVFDLWKNTPFPIAMNIYFFNWTNPDDIRETNIKPRLQEIGPYKFIENKTKVDVEWHKNGTISFKHLRNWHFDRENSVGDLDDVITSLDPVAVSAASAAKNFPYLFQRTVSLSLSALVNNIHVTKKVGEILFDGYDDPLINVAQSLPKITDLELPPFEKFGWFVTRNDSKNYEGKFTMGTGENDAIKFGELYEWNDAKTSKYFSGECGKIGGSAGEFFAQNLPRTEVRLFFSDMCRSISLQFDNEEEWNDIRAYRYIGGEKTFDNGTKYPENLCYCGDKCIASGLISVQNCRYGAPGFISFPHFYLADPVYLEPFEGLEPNKEKHEFYVLIEPGTGIPLYVNGKFQVNLLMEPNPNIALYNDVPKLYFPVLWFREEVLLPEEISTPFKLFLAFPTINKTIAIIFGIIGLFLSINIIFEKKTFIQNYELQLQQL